jgi:hypothetical protein
VSKPARLPAAFALLAVFSLSACYLPSAARHTGRFVKQGWDFDRFGPYTAVTAPGSLLLAAPNFAAHALVPWEYDGYFLIDRREPRQKWFRFYTGPMQPIDRVAILCNRERATTVTTIRGEEHERATFARHAKWHFPQCIEVLPGSYELVVDFYSRETFRQQHSVATYSTESTSPAVLQWDPEPSTVYRLTALLGDVTPNPGGAHPGTTIKRLTRTKTNIGTSEFTMDEGHWLAIVEKVPGVTVFDSPVLEHREAWRRYELSRRRASN